MRILLIALLLAGCTHNISPEDPADCWRYGISMDNTGKMSPTPVDEIPVVKMSYDELLVACGVVDDRTLAQYWRDHRSMAVRACYDPMTDTIYEHHLNLGQRYTNHEKCHVILGRDHNSCYSRGYGIGKDESACEWNKS